MRSSFSKPGRSSCFELRPAICTRPICLSSMVLRLPFTRIGVTSTSMHLRKLVLTSRSSSSSMKSNHSAPFPANDWNSELLIIVSSRRWFSFLHSTKWDFDFDTSTSYIQRFTMSTFNFHRSIYVSRVAMVHLHLQFQPLRARVGELDLQPVAKLKYCI